MIYAVNLEYGASFRRKGKPQQPLSDIRSSTKIDSDPSDEKDPEESLYIPPFGVELGTRKRFQDEIQTHHPKSLRFHLVMRFQANLNHLMTIGLMVFLNWKTSMKHIITPFVPNT